MYVGCALVLHVLVPWVGSGLVAGSTKKGSTHKEIGAGVEREELVELLKHLVGGEFSQDTYEGEGVKSRVG